MPKELINKSDFKKNLGLPKFFWFKNEEEISQLLTKFSQQTTESTTDPLDHEDFDEEATELDEAEVEEAFDLLFSTKNEQRLFKLLTKLQKQPEDQLTQQLVKKVVGLINDEQLDFLKNQFAVYGIVFNELKKFLAIRFKIPFQKIFDHSFKTNRDSSQIILENLDQEEFIYLKPKIIYQNFYLNPSALIKKNNKFYVIESKASTVQKRDNFLDFIFFERIMQRAQYFEVSCYLNVLLKKTKRAVGGSIIDFIITSNIPYTRQVNNKLHKLIKFHTDQYDLINHSQKQLFFHPATEQDWSEQVAGISCARIMDWKIINAHDEKEVDWKQYSFINVNNFLDKSLHFNDYFIQPLPNEMLEGYHYQTYFAEYCLALQSEQWESYHQVYQLVQAEKKRNKFNKTEQTLNWIYTSLAHPELIAPLRNSEVHANEFIDFDHFFDLSKFKTRKLTPDFFYADLNGESKFIDWISWKKLLLCLYPEANYSGNFLRTKKLFEWFFRNWTNRKTDLAIINRKLQTLFFGKYFFKQATPQAFLVNQKAVTLYQEYCQSPNKVYYDFESLALPLAIMEQTYPYQQIVNQISIIKNIDGAGIDHCENRVYDPLHLNVQMFKEIIDLIHVDPNKNPKYIVYNKAFENTRLKEMAVLINEPIYFEKVLDIITNTLDLADFFDYRKTTILAVKLRAYHSIKKVIELVPPEFLAKAKATSYKVIEKVQNGMICQSLSIQRYLNQINNALWTTNVRLMKQYCENDVRSMIAVEYLMEQIVTAAMQNQTILDIEKWTDLNDV
ncbi:hypothetical protein J2Z62_000031 [Mycoplasmoides fastidiosum]|uniref:DUF2779 domain-containing protein n=1 Tax=Mycoplasmoides fastidiosum TaxID=92758 RepID=A0ABU0LY16_9BACT|nr:DUF2779 domain-containing protein [Mycoplasmoides fastidiosum]MDQ0513593.1 hypothetical protein [Mycoplasmoides fastidiosum]UUD37984.1 DUF2779 domain-containing protein [Mycoplasmoides fastidiosum]